MGTRPRGVGFWIAYGGAMALLLVAIDLGLHLVRTYRLNPTFKPPSASFPVIPNAPDDLARRLGLLFYRTDRVTSFTRFPALKPPGTVRIGAFGDSFTFGDEVGETADFPSQLLALLKAHARDRVEVLNFGVNGFGFDETYLMWNGLAEAYDIDYVLLGPRSFQPERTTRFNSFPEQPHYLHSRFVLDGNGLSLVDVLGESYPERFERYYAFLTPWRYLRYDRNDPPFLAAALPRGRVIGNPFYYSGLPEDVEAATIHRRLLTRMKQRTGSILLGLDTASEELRRAMSELADDRLCVFDVKRPAHFPYVAPRGHNSALGNLRVAQFFLAALLGEAISAPILRTGPLPDSGGGAALPLPDLIGYDGLRIVLGGMDVGRLTDSEGRVIEPPALRDRGYRSLIAIKTADESLLDAIVLAVPFEVDASLPIYLFHSYGGRRRSMPLPRETPLSVLPLQQSTDVRLVQRRRRAPAVTADELSALFNESVGRGTLEVRLGEEVLLTGEFDDEESYALNPVKGEFFYFRAVAQSWKNMSGSSGGGTAEFILRHGGTDYSLPVARWWLEPRSVRPDCTDVQVESLREASR